MSVEIEASADPVRTPMRRRGRWWKWGGLVVLLLGFGLFGTFLAWRGGAARGFDREFAAARAAGEPVTAQELSDWPFLRAEGENAVPALRAAADLIKGDSEAWQKAYSPDAQEYAPPLREEEVAALEALVRECEPSLRALDEAVKKSGVNWDLRLTSPMINNLYPDLNKQRTIANLLRAAVLLEHHRGNDAEAVRRIEQTLFVARAVDHQPTLVSHLVAIGVYAMAGNEAALVAPELRVDAAGAGDGQGQPGAYRPATPQAVRSLITQFLDEQPLKDGQRRAWVAERVQQIDSINALADGSLSGGPVSPSLRFKLFFMRPVFHDNGTVIVSHTTKVMHASAGSADLPAYRQKVPAKLPAYLDSRRYFLANILLPGIDRATDQQFRILADRRLAAVALACRLYAVEHDGRLPRKLQDLVPDYLPAVPLDPLAAGGRPLGYVGPDEDPEKPRVYSVGPNGIDQRGADPDRRRTRHRDYEAQRDEVRYLKRQPRPEPEPEGEGMPFGYPGMYPGLPGMQEPDAPPDPEEAEPEAAKKTQPANEPVTDSPPK
ncbi:MAG TPA: hypothetical protein VFB66_13785 [Tepidisphaeraceae bacterium]|nr:hypothetical protein [Tepidisphaeraceae bacterium]